MTGTSMSCTTRFTSIAGAIVLAATLGLSSACEAGHSGPAASSGHQLVGLFKLTPGSAHGHQISGTWFKMVQPSGNVTDGPFMVNSDSKADGGKVTLLQPGVSGGLRTGAYQSQPSPGFDSSGNSLADAIVAPTKFFGVKFSISTNEVDLQTKTKVAPPTVVLKDGKLTADLASWAASWNRQNFNQGAPKPVVGTAAEAPGQAQASKVFDWVSHKYLAGAPKPTVTGGGATGTYDAQTGAFVLTWTSHIVGGPFNGFTGEWHLQGIFQASSAGPPGK